MISYSNNSLAGVQNIYVGSTAERNAYIPSLVDDRWVDVVNGHTYLWNGGQWVDLGSTGLTANLSTFSSDWCVDATDGDDTNDGTSWDNAFATVQAGVNAAATGDKIYIKPGTYAENVVITSKNNLNLIGIVGSGNARPSIAKATGIAIKTVTSHGLYLNHIRTYSGNNDAVYLEGNGNLLIDTILDGNLTATKAGLRLCGSATSAAFSGSETFLVNSLVRGNAYGIIFDTSTTQAIGSTDGFIAYNRFSANTIDIGTKDAGSGTYSVHTTTMHGNVFEDLNKAVYLDFTTTNGGAASDQTGILSNNYFNTSAFTTTNVKNVATGIGFIGNHSAADTSLAGTMFVVTKSVTQSAIVAAGVDLTGVSTVGLIEIEDVIIQNGSTAATGAGNMALLNLVTNNVAGSAAFITDTEAKLVANVAVSGATHTTNNKVVLEIGKKITATATTEDFTSVGTIVFHIICRRLADGATLAAA